MANSQHHCCVQLPAGQPYSPKLRRHCRCSLFKRLNRYQRLNQSTRWYPCKFFVLCSRLRSVCSSTLETNACNFIGRILGSAVCEIRQVREVWRPTHRLGIDKIPKIVVDPVGRKLRGRGLQVCGAQGREFRTRLVRSASRPWHGLQDVPSWV
jgi:hypothetical protein